jgi:phosphohistidine swiveling domain-containing protein
MFQLWGALTIFILCPLMGALPLIGWITKAFGGRHLAGMNAGNISVATAFYKGGTLAGILAILSEALKGIAVILLIRAFFKTGSAPLELFGLMALVIGRYFQARKAATANVAWGFSLHDPLASTFGLLLVTISFTFLKDRQLAKFGVLVIVPLIVAILHFEDFPRIVATACLGGLLAFIYTRVPDDFDFEISQTQTNSKAPYQYVRKEQTILSLGEELDVALVGNKAASLSEIISWGYPVPKGWVLTPLEDSQRLIDYLQPSELSPLVVRSSAIEEDSEKASAPGQYLTVLNVTTKEGLITAIARVQASYDHPTSVQYRRDMKVKDTAMAVLIQQQVKSVFSGVAFSRDPMSQEDDAVLIEVSNFSGSDLVSRGIQGQYRAFVVDTENYALIQLEGSGNVPSGIIKQVAILVRRLEERYQGVPLDVEWCYDGRTLWVLQARPISTLMPVWTRRLVTEFIPGTLHPLSWSVNRPLMSSVCGGLLALVLGARAVGLDFNESFELRYSRAYFNASLLGKILRAFGLPPESLEYFTQQAKLDKPTVDTIVQNLPGLVRLLLREFTLEKDFQRDYKRRFSPALSQLKQELVEDLSTQRLMSRIEFLLELLRVATYYNVFVPLSVSTRKRFFKVKDSEIDNSQSPDLASTQKFTELAVACKEILTEFDPENVFDDLAVSAKGQEMLAEFNKLLRRYGYLSEDGRDIAIPTWREEPQKVKQFFVQLMQENAFPATNKGKRKKIKKSVQSRVDLAARVNEVYLRLLANLRWSFVALEQILMNSSALDEPGDIFFLELDEIRRLVGSFDSDLITQVPDLVQMRRSQFIKNSRLNVVPLLVYGNTPKQSERDSLAPFDSYQVLQGVPTSNGITEGRIKLLRDLQALPKVNKETILVLPYADSGWAPLVMNAGGLIIQSGGRLSHIAILAREYGIPTVSDVQSATWLLQDNQWVRIDGTRGIVEISNNLRPE